MIYEKGLKDAEVYLKKLGLNYFDLKLIYQAEDEAIL